MATALNSKMRRRIKRQIETGKEQHRVVKLDDNTYQYVVKHHSETVTFRRTKMGRLRRVVQK